MMMRLVVGLLLLGTADSRRMKIASIRFTNITSAFNPRTIGFHELFITPNTGGQSVEMNSRLLVNVTEQLRVTVNMRMKDRAKDLYKQIVVYTVDVCNLREDFLRHTVVQFWIKSIKKYSNLPLRCPVFAGMFYIRGLRVNSSSVPMFLLSGLYVLNVVLEARIETGVELLTNSTVEVMFARD